MQDGERVEYEQPVLVPGARTARKVGVLLMIIYKTTRRPLFGCLFVHPYKNTHLTTTWSEFLAMKNEDPKSNLNCFHLCFILILTSMVGEQLEPS